LGINLGFEMVVREYVDGDAYSVILAEDCMRGARLAGVPETLDCAKLDEN
jgi:hypothetical protein